MSMKFEMEGFAELERKLKAMGPEVSTKAGQKATNKAAQHVAKKVRAAAPVGDADTSRTYKTAAGTQTADYGHLKRNIRTQKRKKKGKHTVGTMVGTSNAFWGYFLEFGTRKMGAKPWFRPAVESALPEAFNIMKAELKKALEAAANKGPKK